MTCHGLLNSPPRKLLKLEVLLLLLSGGFGFAIGYLQNSWPRRAREESCCLFLASRIALGSVNWTGNSSLCVQEKQTETMRRKRSLIEFIKLKQHRLDYREKEGFNSAFHRRLNYLPIRPDFHLAQLGFISYTSLPWRRSLIN